MAATSSSPARPDEPSALRYYAGFAASVLANLVGQRIEEEPPYDVVKAEGAHELRQYQEQVVVRTVMHGGYDGSSDAFRRLVGYITGKNRGQSKIAMTAPVVMQEQGARIAMTAPVVMQQVAPDAMVMEFILPGAFSMETAPEPTEDGVWLASKPGQLVATRQFSGRLEAAAFDAEREQLQQWIAAQGNIRATAPGSFAGYDSPFTPSWWRRNEVMIPVEIVDDDEQEE